MRNDLTDITVVMDTSGSMWNCIKDATGGINAFVKEQKEQPGSARFTLVEFASETKVVYDGIDIKSVPEIASYPGGRTALLDAVGKTISTIGKRLNDTPVADRPGAVIVVIVTDGDENSSIEYKKPQIKEMIDHQQSVYNWKFIFLGANQDAFAEGGSIGMTHGLTANYDTQNVQAAYAATSGLVRQMRSATAMCQTMDNISFNDQDRNSLVGQG